ncbi:MULTISPECIES: SNF2-related protein [Leuconostoc]|uniref:SNF2-related protein n=1 Tax=Leuconostoc TaxID=1243 RepID=UPI0021823D27|nr:MULTISPECIES: SNF2-related protein [Leuconostoc]MCS8595933.1 DNA/RNA helicase [Leuconostoc citreum]
MLTDTTIKPGYTTPIDNVGRDFYTPALINSVRYDRISGYFSARSLLYFSKGIEGLIRNNGKYRLIISSEISETDYELIKQGYELKEHQFVLPDFSGLVNSIDQMHLSNLAYLISIGLVDIKIGFTPYGLFHAKYGTMTDLDGNSIYFSGSFNETENAFINNFERIDVKKSWISEADSEYIHSEQRNFDLLWNGDNQDGLLFVKNVNDILKNELVKYSKGRLIMDSAIMKQNALIMYIDTDSLHIQDNLNGVQINTSSRKIKRLKKFMTGGILWNFKKNIGYKDIQTIIDIFEKEAVREGFNFVVADSVYEFISNSQFKIDEIARRGFLIKNKDASLTDDIMSFQKVLDVEIIRSLYPEQLWVSYYMARMQRVGNFSVPGAGKTSMVYGAYAYLSSPKVSQIDKMVVIGPKNSFLAWKTEFYAVFGNKRKLNVLDVQSTDFRKEQFYKNVTQYNLILVNYESLKTHYNDLINLINAKTLLIFDEVHKVKGIEAITPKYAMAIAERASFKFVLTGTPIPNGYSDIYNLLHILYPEEYRDYFGFTISNLQKADQVIGQEINDKLFPFFWRVTKKDLNVPEVEPDKVCKVKASDDEQDVINLLWLKYGHNPFKLYIRLIQLASNPELLQKNINRSLFVDVENDDSGATYNLDFEFSDEMSDEPDYSASDLLIINKIKESTKFKKAVEKAELLIKKGEKPIVWAIFIDTIDKFANEMRKKGYKIAVIYGSVKAMNREKIIKKFQNGNYDLLISNPHTLAESVSLHRVSHVAMYLEYSFNLTHMLQSRDRIHRLGLKENQKTNYYYFELEGKPGERNTIDDKIYNRLKEKEKIMLEAIEGNQLVPNFSIDEKQEILNFMAEN